jgi:putative lipoic acid-binding regulatory protein
MTDHSAMTALTAYVAASHSGHVTEQTDIQVNQYPGRRDFKAIGSGGEDFKQTIIRAVEDVVGPVKEDRVVQRPSSQGKFISITLKDVKVQNPDQVC